MYITKKKFGKKIYYYVVENKLVNGKPKMQHILYLGTVEKILQTFKKIKQKKN